jgi:hypothetical protein
MIVGTGAPPIGPDCATPECFGPGSDDSPTDEETEAAEKTVDADDDAVAADATDAVATTPPTSTTAASAATQRRARPGGKLTIEPFTATLRGR